MRSIQRLLIFLVRFIKRAKNEKTFRRFIFNTCKLTYFSSEK